MKCVFLERQDPQLLADTNLQRGRRSTEKLCSILNRSQPYENGMKLRKMLIKHKTMFVKSETIAEM